MNQVKKGAKLKESMPRCPRCGAVDEVTALGQMQVDGDTAWQEVECTRCGLLVHEVYEFSYGEVQAAPRYVPKA